ncbi:MAG: 2,6-beta-D-fructofuranosidase, partial [Armatimonadota bacterium]|nr:2,6-beta-D-fructofuranosidase [Armatimonadota bacterium]
MAERVVQLRRRYLSFPVKSGAPIRRVSLWIGGQAVREFDIELAEGDPDFWVFLDVSFFAGHTATLRAGAPGEEVPALRRVVHGDQIPGSEELYREAYRPQFHFSARRGWLNDPNGLVYFRGEYHLFYQHNPYGCRWGNMHWGHAVSTDLVRWRELSIALYPRCYGDWVFSGSAVIDWRRTSGLGAGSEPPMVAVFTSTGRGECLAYSTDRGRSFTEFEGNPVFRHQGRDPRV